MPQLDKLTFITQLSWLLATFFGLYVLLLRFVLPRLASAIKIRQREFIGVVWYLAYMQDLAINFRVNYFKITSDLLSSSVEHIRNAINKIFAYKKLKSIYVTKNHNMNLINKYFFEEFRSNFIRSRVWAFLYKK